MSYFEVIKANLANIAPYLSVPDVVHGLSSTCKDFRETLIDPTDYINIQPIWKFFCQRDLGFTPSNAENLFNWYDAYRKRYPFRVCISKGIFQICEFENVTQRIHYFVRCGWNGFVAFNQANSLFFLPDDNGEAYLEGSTKLVSFKEEEDLNAIDQRNLRFLSPYFLLATSRKNPKSGKLYIQEKIRKNIGVDTNGRIPTGESTFMRLEDKSVVTRNFKNEVETTIGVPPYLEKKVTPNLIHLWGSKALLYTNKNGVILNLKEGCVEEKYLLDHATTGHQFFSIPLDRKIAAFGKGEMTILNPNLTPFTKKKTLQSPVVQVCSLVPGYFCTRHWKNRESYVHIWSISGVKITTLKLGNDEVSDMIYIGNTATLVFSMYGTKPGIQRVRFAPEKERPSPRKKVDIRTLGRSFKEGLTRLSGESIRRKKSPKDSHPSALSLFKSTGSLSKTNPKTPPPSPLVKKRLGGHRKQAPRKLVAKKGATKVRRRPLPKLPPKNANRGSAPLLGRRGPPKKVPYRSSLDKKKLTIGSNRGSQEGK